MIPQSKIDKGIYWERAWQLVDGCTKVSEGCEHCWSEAMAKRFNAKSIYQNGTFDWQGKLLLRVSNLDLPLRIKKPTVFSIWNDLFHESVPFEFVDKAGEVMDNCSQHTFLILTKRPQRLAEYTDYEKGRNWERNTWLGVTPTKDEDIATLLQIPAAHRFVSLEPLLGDINIKSYLMGHEEHGVAFGRPVGTCVAYTPPLDWVIVGAETGPKARYCPIENIESIVEQCKVAGVSVFVKAVHLGTSQKFKISKKMSEWPESVRVRELPYAEQ